MIFSGLDDVTKWLFGHVRADAPRGEAALEASRSLFAALGNPQDSAPAIHIVGTAGKGTVGAFLTQALVDSGERVVTHQSPHVYDIRERFLLDGELPSEESVLAAAREVVDAAAGLDSAPTFFALTAALAAVIGRNAGVDRQVVEAGIGGRLDATNVFTRADVITVITPIGLDHTEVLGETVAEIAAEKAAVLVGRGVAVMAPQAPDADAEIREAAAAYGVALVEVEPSSDWRTVARTTAAAVLGDSFDVPHSVSLPGRYEQLEWRGRPLILDGAHNPMKLQGLAESLRADGFERIVGVVALGTGKELDESAEVIASFSAAVVATTFGPADGEFGPSGVDPRDLAEALTAAGVVDVVEAATPVEIDAALTTFAERGNEPADAVVVTGSFLHLAAVRHVLLGL